MNEKKFNTIEDALADIKIGKMILVADDESRENEGDLICASQYITAEKVNFMASECKGLICTAITKEKAHKLNLSEMVSENTDIKHTAFSQTIDADPKYGVTTGISAFDRAKTINLLADENSIADDFRRPGHVFPLIAREGGVLTRAGHTEAAVDLASLAGLIPCATICEIMNKDGTMARRDDLFEFAKLHNLKFITVQDLISYRLKTQRFVFREAQASLPTEYGLFEIIGYRNSINNTESVALVVDKPEAKDKIPLVRVHSECLTGDIFHSLKCDCNYQLIESLKMIQEYGKGALIYIRGHEGRGIGLINKIKAYKLQEMGEDTVQANISLGFKPDLRDYGVGAQILSELGYSDFDLLTNNPKKIIGLEGYGLKINNRVPINPKINLYNEKYIKTKVSKMEHMIKL